MALIPLELLRKIRRIEIHTGRLAEDLFAGKYRSVFKGRGMDFEEAREYQPGDEVRRIDWNISARFDSPYVKVFREERELTMILLVDLSASGVFGTSTQTKKDLIAELAAVLAFSAVKNSDRVGLLLFTDRVEKFIRPAKGRRHVLRLIRDILYHEPVGRKTNLTSALTYLNHVAKRRAVCFLISDFLDNDFATALKITNKRHDLIGMRVMDARENTLPNVGWVALEDAETGEMLEINTGDAAVRKRFADEAIRRSQELRRTCSQAGVQLLEMATNHPYERTLQHFFETRISGRHGK